MKKRLLVLGAGRHQRALIRRIEERNLEAVVSDYYPDAPGKRYATYPTDTDALDTASNIRLAKAYGISGVLTSGTDQAVVVMSEVANEMGLPCYITPSAARTATNKLLMKQAFTRELVPQKPYMEMDKVLDQSGVGDNLCYPVVVKPADSQGQRGVQRIDKPDNIQGAVAAALKASKAGKVVIEEFIPGYEVTVNGWILDGQPRILSITDRITFNPIPAVGICFQHVFPSLRARGLRDRMEDIVRRIARCYGLQQGPLYIQTIISDGEVYVVEAAARVGGGHEESSIPLATGVDLRDRLIDLALWGECAPFDYEFAENMTSTHVLVNFLLPRSGSIQRQEGFQELIDSGIIDEGECYYPVGHHCPEIVDGQGRVGYFIVKDVSRERVLQRARHSYSSLRIWSEDGCNLLFWPSERQLNG